jgi:hypothetical protein
LPRADGARREVDVRFETRASRAWPLDKRHDIFDRLRASSRFADVRSVTEQEET